MQRLLSGVSLALVAVVQLSACGSAPLAFDDIGYDDGEDAGEDDIAEVTAELRQVPSGIACVQLIVGTTTTKYTVTAGQASINLGKTKAGSITVSGNAFTQACSGVSASTVPAWIADATTTTVYAAIPNNISLIFHRNNRDTSVSLEFQDSVDSIEVGTYSTFAIVAGGGVKAWGSNSGGALLDGTTTHRYTPVTSNVPSGTVQLASGEMFGCARLADQTVSCWGANYYGVLGDGTTTSRSSAAPVPGLTGVTRVCAGAYHACALTTTGLLYCWGGNGAGQLGDGTNTNRSSPVQVSTGTQEVACGRVHTCAVGQDASVYCWGHNSSGQLGVGTTTDSNVRGAYAGTGPTRRLAAGAGTTCASLYDGTVECWGNTTGSGTTAPQTTPVPVLGIAGKVTDVAVGNYTAFALTTSGELYGWGVATGDGTLESRLSAVLVASDVAEVASGDGHACLRYRSTPGVSCWGLNGYGQLGDGTKNRRWVPTPVSW